MKEILKLFLMPCFHFCTEGKNCLVLLPVWIHTDKCVISGLLSVWIRTAVCALSRPGVKCGLRTCGRADQQRGKVRTKFADPVRILPLRDGFGKVRSPHFIPAFDNTKCMAQ